MLSNTVKFSSKDKPMEIENTCKKIFEPIEVLFPEWDDARSRIETWFKKIKDIEITYNLTSYSIDIMFQLPKLENSLLSEKDYMHYIFPPVEQEKISNIVASTIFIYKHPNYDSMLNKIGNENNIIIMKSMHKEVVDNIVNLGGRKPLDELRFRLGLGISIYSENSEERVETLVNDWKNQDLDFDDMNELIDLLIKEREK